MVTFHWIVTLLPLEIACRAMRNRAMIATMATTEPEQGGKVGPEVAVGKLLAAMVGAVPALTELRAGIGGRPGPAQEVRLGPAQKISNTPTTQSRFSG